jgi:hypothetical protein
VTSSDVIRVRIADDDLADGSIPIEEHTRTSQKVRDMMMAAACTAIERRAVWHKRKPDLALAYLRSVRIGQTERGSYVLTVISRVPPMLRSGHLPFEEEPEDPFERKVTRGLADALLAIKQAAEGSAADGSVDAFEAAVPLGVTANLCDAVAGLSSDDDSDRSVEFAFSWSRSRPVTEGQVSSIVLPSDRVPFVREAGRLLRKRSPIEDFALQGPVVKLERAEGSPVGWVTVLGIVDNEPKHVRVQLPEREYARAVDAHRNAQAVSCTGRLVREGRGYELGTPTWFSDRPQES